MSMSRLRSRLVAVALASACLGTVVGCASVQDKVRQQAAFKFNCPEAQITVTPLPDDQYGARGCGQQVTCYDIPFAGVHCDGDK